MMKVTRTNDDLFWSIRRREKKSNERIKNQIENRKKTNVHKTFALQYNIWREEKRNAIDASNLQVFLHKCLDMEANQLKNKKNRKKVGSKRAREEKKNKHSLTSLYLVQFYSK